MFESKAVNNRLWRHKAGYLNASALFERNISEQSKYVGDAGDKNRRTLGSH
jgi:hypothetical protein